MRARGSALAMVWALALAVSCALAFPVTAQEEATGTSYVNPFPPGDIYKLQAYGDAFAEGLLAGLNESLAGDTRLQLQRRHRSLGGIARADFEDELRVEEAPGREAMHIGVIMIGYGDRISIRMQTGRRVSIDSDEWRQEYGRRVDRFIKALKRQGIALYWIGLPILRRADANDDAQVMNDVVREKAYLNGIKFIDIQSHFADEAGNYAAYGPDLTGKSRLLRENDGILFTPTGYRKLAHFVEQEIKRDLTQARNERAIPLAGTEAEQKRIVSQRPRTPSDGDGGWKGTVNAVKEAKAGGQPKSSGTAQPVQTQPDPEQKAENGRITLKSIGANGREESITIDIPRPAIPSAVIALMTRKESSDRASQIGDVVAEDVGGGLVVMSSITPSGGGPGGVARRIAPSQTPYYQVLVKGERAPSKPGRADDFSWPRADADLGVSTMTNQPARRQPRLPPRS